MLQDKKTIAEVNSYTSKTLKEHILIQRWANRESGIDSFSHVAQKTKESEPEELIEELVREGNLTIENGRVIFTGQGEVYAEILTRRHRLAEVLLSEILEMGNDLSRSQVCEFEHILTPEVTESICTFLGHPLHCPHGMPIPRGECCATFQKKIGPFIKPLIDLKIGETGKIVFMTPKTHFRLDRLITFGITPGSIIKLHQKKPSVVLQIGETELALDYDIAKNIYVKQANDKI